MSKLTLAPWAADKCVPAEARGAPLRGAPRRRAGRAGGQNQAAGRRYKLVFRPEQPCHSRVRGTGPTSPRTEPPGAGGRARDAALKKGTSPALCGLRPRGSRAGRGRPSATSGQPPLPSPGKGGRAGPGRGRGRTSHPVSRPPELGWAGGGGWQGGGALRTSRRRGAISLPLPAGRRAGGAGGCEHPRTGGAGREGCTEGPGPERR